ncbi:MAG: hypothetical protein DI626_07180 [Micavibrio aeruginosavorus]|uniref:Uncharacterized protein n=1 Tax=Micavibrio aeruginosavorus TaxID=349221 RepID=A0A2W4ZU18_9BACT|nr:MAG: hypothetical protein DI626_07180 [Micavibrio aeruginosavorus]
MSPASTALRLSSERSKSPERTSATIVRLFGNAAEDNEALRKKQYERQREMMAEALKNAPPAAEVTRSVQNQALRYTPADEMTVGNQAAMQGAKGFAFKL